MASKVAMTLPASWYRERAIYDLERRAIFGKTWFMISHSLRFTKPGEYVKFDMAGYHFFIIKDGEGNINGFLNVCRHRACPIVKDTYGQATVLSCNCHEESYGLDGKPASAPRSDIKESGSSDSTLHKVHIHIDQYGWVFVNLDSAKTPTITWQEQFEGVDSQPLINEHYDFSNYTFSHTFTLDGHFNWKCLIQNYNECYHCPAAHPSLRGSVTHDTDLPHDMIRNYIIHRSVEEEGKTSAATMCPTFVFPNNQFTMTKPFIYMMSIVPTGPGECVCKFEIYRNKYTTDEEYNGMFDWFIELEKEDNAILNTGYKNLTNDMFVAGPLEPVSEDTVAFVENVVRGYLVSHVQAEKKAGHEIWPARREQSDTIVKEDEPFFNRVQESGGVKIAVS